MEALSWSAVLPPMLKSILMRLPAGTYRELEEIRIRVGRPLEIGVMGDFQLVTERGSGRTIRMPPTAQAGRMGISCSI